MESAENQKPEEEQQEEEVIAEAEEAAAADAAEEAAASEAEEVESDSDVDAPAEDSVAAELADAKDKLLRALAEAENVRRRAQRDVDNANKRAISGFAREMIVVADNLHRALGAVDAATAEANEAMKTLLQGVEMTAREMMNAFERNGLQKVDPTGEKFDPQVHEAMFEYEDASKPTGTVGQVMEMGYTLHGQTLRPAKVGVTKGGPKGDAPKPSEQILAEAEKDKNAESGKVYEDQGTKSGTHLDEEL